MKKVIVTGASGYIGSFLQKELDHNNLFEKVYLSTSKSGTEYIRTNYEDEHFSQALSGADCIIHLAARKKVTSLEEMYENITLTKKIVDAACAAKVKHFIFASTISVYSGEETLPWNEKTIPEPDTLYGLSKLAGEHIVRMGAQKAGMEYTILRLSHVIGDNMPGAYMMPVFFRRAAAGEALTVMGKSVAVRELVDVLDVCRVIAWCVDRKEVFGEIINVGPGSGLSNIEIAHIIADSCEGVTVEYQDEMPERMVSSFMDVDKLKSYDLEPLLTPEQIIRRICRNF